MKRPVLTLVASSALIALGATPAAHAQSPASSDTDAAAAAATTERITITGGRGQVRSVQALSRDEFEAASAAGQSPLATVARLPGVNFQSADALGNYEWSARFTVRAFSQNQLGFTLDGVPLGDMSYGNLNGLHISRAISSENVARALLSQGTGALDTASSSNLGGTLQFYSSDPAETFGFSLAQTFGTDGNLRTFARLDSGETALGSVFLSLTRQAADKWKGSGQQRQDQLNLKLAKTFGDHRLTAFLNTSDRSEIDYQDMSLEMIDRLGYGWDNFYPDFAAAVNASNTLCGNGGSTYVPQCDDAYYAGSGLRKDSLGGITLDAALADGIDLRTTLYHHDNRGRGLWYTPYTPSPDGTPVSLRTTEYGIDRWGVTATLDMALGAHQLRAFVWTEDNDHRQARRFYATSPGAVPDPYVFPKDPFFTQWQYRFNTRTTQFAFSDTVELTDRLSLSAGFKSLSADITAQRLVGTGPQGSISASKGFLPQFGLNYRLSKSDEVFAGLSRNMRVFQASAVGTTPFATTQEGFDAIKDTLRPETSTNLELGWRTGGRLYEGAVTLYAVDFRDRLLGVTQGAGILGNPTVLSNVGGVRTHGLEAALSVRLMRGLSWYNSLSLSKSTYRDDVVSRDASDQVSVVPIAGKEVVDAPRTMFKSVLSWDDGVWFGEAGFDHMSKRYYSYLNDASVPGRSLVNVSAGVRIRPLGFLTAATLRAGITNLTDRRYVATLGSNGFVNSDPAGTAQTLQLGAPRQVFLTLAGDF